jgi:hypothetical protein
VELIFEGCDDSEIAASTAQAPEEVRVLRGAGGQEATVGRDHIGRDEIVDGQAVLAGEPAEAAPEGEPGDARIGDRAAGGGEPKGLRLVVELDPLSARLSPGRAGRGIDTDGFHRGEIDHEASVADRVAREAVAPPAHGHLQPMVPSEGHGADDVGGPGTAGNQGWPSVKHPVPQLAALVVGIVTGTQHVTPQTSLEPDDSGCLDA